MNPNMHGMVLRMSLIFVKYFVGVMGRVCAHPSIVYACKAVPGRRG